jgi:hypothetical protein
MLVHQNIKYLSTNFRKIAVFILIFIFGVGRRKERNIEK